MWLVFICSFFCVLQSAFSDRAVSLIMAIVSVITAILVELLLTWKTYGLSKISDGSAAATAMILTMLLPNQLHPVYAVLGTAFAIVAVKYCFGGLGSNWLNPALGGWLFIRFSWPSAFNKSLEAASLSINEMLAENGAVDNIVSEFLNNSIFSLFKTRLPSGYIALLFSKAPGFITDRGLFAMLAGTIIITAFRISRSWVPLVFLSVYGFLIRMAGGTVLWSGDILYGFFSGGTIAAAFILATEPASSARLKPGILFNIILNAVLSWFFRYQCQDYSGCFIAFALVNCLTPVVRYLEEKIFFYRKTGLYKGAGK
jgi:Na+-translocating ferredoxin:NAD+ oxidoreductase RnfD subunit